jgi:hypothetical protein
VWVLITRRHGWASRAAIVSSIGTETRSNQGERRVSGAGSRSPCTSSAAPICVQVVPHLGAVATMMSPARGR